MPLNKKTVYLVQQVPWEEDAELEGHFVRGDLEEGSSVQGFSDRGRAEALCAELERDFRGRFNPFLYGRGLDDWTSWPECVLRDWLLDAGLSPPESGADPADWVAWWEAHQPLTELQRQRVWEGLDRVRFFAVVELGPAGTRLQ
jgi:hypothetical protein